jgi:hypothetical protein
VIKQAMKDTVGRSPEYRADAFRYFASPLYETDMELVGLHPDMVPASIVEIADERQTA